MLSVFLGCINNSVVTRITFVGVLIGSGISGMTLSILNDLLQEIADAYGDRKKDRREIRG